MSIVPVALVLFLIGRAALAGDVSVSVSGGSLRVVGSSDSDVVTIDQTGLAETHEFRVAPGASTTINGSAAARRIRSRSTQRASRVTSGPGPPEAACRPSRCGPPT